VAGSIEDQYQLAIVMMNTGEVEESVELLQRLLGESLELKGEDDIDTLKIYANLSTALILADRKKAALAAILAALDGFRDVKGPAHPDTLRATITASELMSDCGMNEEAFQLIHPSIFLAEKSLGAEHDLSIDVLSAALRAAAVAGHVQTAMTLTERIRTACRFLPETDPRRQRAESVWFNGGRPERLRVTDELSVVSFGEGDLLVDLVGRFDGEVTDLFCVGMHATTVRGLQRALDSEKPDWSIADRSLRVTGTSDTLELHFTSTKGAVSPTITLTGADLNRFRHAVGQRRDRTATRGGDADAPPPRPGRNDPCYCGSGRKYKKCCGVAD